MLNTKRRLSFSLALAISLGVFTLSQELYSDQVFTTPNGQSITVQGSNGSYASSGWSTVGPLGGTISNSGRTVSDQNGVYTITNPGWVVYAPSGNTASSGWTTTGALGQGYTMTNNGWAVYAPSGNTASSGWTTTGALGQGYTMTNNGWAVYGPDGAPISNAGWTVTGQIGEGYTINNPGWVGNGANYTLSNGGRQTSGLAGQGYQITDNGWIVETPKMVTISNGGWTGSGEVGQGYSLTGQLGYTALAPNGNSISYESNTNTYTVSAPTQGIDYSQQGSLTLPKGGTLSSDGTGYTIQTPYRTFSKEGERTMSGEIGQGYVITNPGWSFRVPSSDARTISGEAGQGARISGGYHTANGQIGQGFTTEPISGIYSTGSFGNGYTTSSTYVPERNQHTGR